MDNANQKLITVILEVCNKNYKFEQIFYKNILDKDNISDYKKLILEIHIRVIIQHIYFIWKSDINIYMADFIEFGKLLSEYGVRLTPFDDYSTLVSNILNIFIDKSKRDHIYKINNYLETLVIKYNNIDIFTINGKNNNDSISNNKPFDNKPSNYKPSDNKPFNNKQFDNKPSNNKQFNNKPSNYKPFDNKSFNNKPLNNGPLNNSNNKPFDNKSYDNKPCDKNPVIFREKKIKNTSHEFTQFKLSLLRVDGLKDLCRKHNIKLTSEMRRIDLENALLKM